MEALELAVKLLEKVSVLVAVVLFLVLIRPAGVWLGETGSQASVRRRLLLILILGGLAIWGIFLGLEISGMRFNVRMVGIIVAGYLGGTWVGLLVGAAAGAFYGLTLEGPLAFYSFAASVLVGFLAGMWTRRFGARFVSVVLGAVAVQMIYHAAVGGVMAIVDTELAATLASNYLLHVAKITANVVGVALFMGLLNLARELEKAREVAEESRDLVRTARLEALQYQVKPHFLFNLLNTLGYLIRTEPSKARELTLDLSEFLRYTLSRQEDVTTLRDELEQIERYVELERARFGDGLKFDVTVPPDDVAARVKVPPLILQPLVENAIRHGATDGEVDVEIHVEHDDGRVRIAVLDNGPGPAGQLVRLARGRSGSDERGVGLRNVRERLQRFYHGEAELLLRERDDGEGACAEFTVPIDIDVEGGLAEQAREQLRKVVT